jgi:hypothetical protein
VTPVVVQASVINPIEYTTLYYIKVYVGFYSGALRNQNRLKTKIEFLQFSSVLVSLFTI